MSDEVTMLFIETYEEMWILDEFSVQSAPSKLKWQI